MTPENPFDKILDDVWEIEKERFLEELAAYIIIAGGRKFELHHLETMPLRKVMNLIWPNQIRLQVKHTQIK